MADVVVTLQAIQTGLASISAGLQAFQVWQTRDRKTANEVFTRGLKEALHSEEVRRVAVQLQSAPQALLKALLADIDRCVTDMKIIIDENGRYLGPERDRALDPFKSCICHSLERLRTIFPMYVPQELHQSWWEGFDCPTLLKEQRERSR